MFLSPPTKNKLSKPREAAYLILIDIVHGKRGVIQATMLLLELTPASSCLQQKKGLSDLLERRSTELDYVS